jgi:hypothetical protein
MFLAQPTLKLDSKGPGLNWLDCRAKMQIHGYIYDFLFFFSSLLSFVKILAI